MNQQKQLNLTSVFEDMHNMHNHYGVHDAVEKLSGEQLTAFFEFRMDLLREELVETYQAFKGRDPEELVDGLIDLIVVAAGTLDLFEVDAQRAWDAVLEANLAKEVGIKEGRPNPLGLPDLTKPEDWKAPSHANNHGRFTEID